MDMVICGRVYYKQNVSFSGNEPDPTVIILRKFIGELNCCFLYVNAQW